MRFKILIFYPTKPTSKMRSKKRNAGSHLQEVQLTAEQIKEIYALPATPQYIVDVIYQKAVQYVAVLQIP